MQNNIKPIFSPNKEQIKQHLEFLFKDCRGHDDGKIEIAYTPSNSPAVNKAEFFDVDDIDKAADFAYDKNANEGVNVYVGAALREPDTAPFGRSNTDDYYASYVVWCDLDDAQAAKTAKDKYKDLPPSLVVVTGREPNTRAQAWWKLQTLEEDKALLKDNLAHICNALGGDPAVVDPARVMRLGGTIAYPKKGGRVTECTEVIVPPNPTKMVNINKFKSYFDIPQDAPLISNPDTAFKNPITGTFKIDALLQESRVEGKWHSSIRDAISSMVGKGWTDEQIRIATNPYLRDRSLIDDMITPLITTARNKYNHPEPPPKIDEVIRESFDPETGEIKDDLKGEELRKLPLLYASDIAPSFEMNDFVEDLLCNEQFSVTYGESNCGKTFAMLDLAMHVAMGLEWREKHVEQGAVLYCALEGGQGTKNRIVAFKKHHGITGKIPLAIIPSNINFLDTQGDILSLLQAIKDAQVNIGNIKLIIIDTLARAISGGDENSGQDMGQMIINADAIREVTKAHINFVHHSGKDTAKGARGHSSLRAAVDTEIEISREDTTAPSVIKVVKQREIEMIEDMAFKLERVVLGETKRGKEVTSCVVLASELEVKSKGKKLTPIQDFIYMAICDAITEYGMNRKVDAEVGVLKCISYTDLHQELDKKGYKDFLETEKKTSQTQVKNATTNARIALKKAGKIGFLNDYIWLAE